MVFATNILNEKQYLDAVKSGANTFIYNQIDFNLERNDTFKFVDSNFNRVPSTWYLWKKNSEKIESFKRKFPELFKVGQYDITLAIQKAVYWSNFRTSFVNYTYETFFKDQSIYYLEDLYQCNKAKVLIKYFKATFNLQKHVKVNHQFNTKKNTTGILVADSFQFSIYKHLLINIVNDDNFIVFVNSSAVKEQIIELCSSASNVVIIDAEVLSPKFPWIDLRKLKDTDWYILNQILNEWEHIHKVINDCEAYIQNGIKKLLINEGENGVVGAIIGEVMNKNNVLTYNTMNGMKSGEAQDSFVSFNYWFVWDQKMKELLVQNNQLPETMLLVSGHLMEDEISKYQEATVSEKNSSKKVISLFSVRGKRKTKLNAFAYLFNYAESHPDIHLLIRRHPSEDENDLILPNTLLENVEFVEYDNFNSKETLYEQLAISHMSICFGSTVALESKWFGVPCITYEIREKSLVYLVDNETIFHVRDLNQFEQKFKELLTFSKSEKLKLHKVANYIKETLLH